MITWVTVWVLTIHSQLGGYGEQSYQLQYATQEICEKQKANHSDKFRKRCDFQQIPVVTK